MMLLIRKKLIFYIYFYCFVKNFYMPIIKYIQQHILIDHLIVKNVKKMYVEHNQLPNLIHKHYQQQIKEMFLSK